MERMKGVRLHGLGKDSGGAHIGFISRLEVLRDTCSVSMRLVTLHRREAGTERRSRPSLPHCHEGGSGTVPLAVLGWTPDHL